MWWVVVVVVIEVIVVRRGWGEEGEERQAEIHTQSSVTSLEDCDDPGHGELYVD